MIQNTGIRQGYSNLQALKSHQVLSAQMQQRQGRTVTANTFVLQTDRLTLSYNSASITTYGKSMTVAGGQQNGYDTLRDMVADLFKKQGLSQQVPTGDGQVDIDKITPDQATGLVADDGYFGIAKTSDRIVDFATGLAGGDTSKLDTIKAAVEKGFNQAMAALGGQLPDISQSTHDAIMEKLDAWANGDGGNQGS